MKGEGAMWKGVTAAMAGAILLALMALSGCQSPTDAPLPPPPASLTAGADKSVVINWTPNCKTDATTGKRRCSLTLMARGPVNGPMVLAMVGFGQTKKNGTLFLTAWAVSPACPGKPLILRVDKNPAVTLQPENPGREVVIGAKAEALAEQFLSGDSLVLRVWFTPACTASDLTIPLKGFAAAWKQFEAEGD